MKFSIAILFAVAALAAADVSHLKDKYLPPHHGSASNNHEQYESAPTNFDSSFQSAPAETTGFSGFEGAASFTSNQYTAPDNSLSGFSSDSSYSAPESAASFNSFQTAEYQAPASSSFQSSYSVPEGAASVAHFRSVLPAPASRSFGSDSSFSAPEGAASFVAPQTTSFSSDSSYSAPDSAASQSSPSFSNSFDSSYSAPAAAASEVNTHYAADGGYVY